jgi:hypothetical protein
MCAEGIILIDRDGSAQRIKQEAQVLLDQGPEPLSAVEVTKLRYQLTDNLDDFAGSVRPGESFFIAATVAELTTALTLGYHRQWIGKGKWMPRALHAFGTQLAQRLINALDSSHNEKKRIGLSFLPRMRLSWSGADCLMDTPRDSLKTLYYYLEGISKTHQFSRARFNSYMGRFEL